MADGLRAMVRRSVDTRNQAIMAALDAASLDQARARFHAAVQLLCVVGNESPWSENVDEEAESLYWCIEADVKRVLLHWHRAPGMRVGTPCEVLRTPDPSIPTLREALETFLGLETVTEYGVYGCPSLRVKAYVSPAWEAKARSAYAAPFHRAHADMLVRDMTAINERIATLRGNLSDASESGDQLSAQIKALMEIMKSYGQ